jgi:hypothetical protein
MINIAYIISNFMHLFLEIDNGTLDQAKLNDMKMIDNQESSRLLDKMKIRGKIPYAGINSLYKHVLNT